MARQNHPTGPSQAIVKRLFAHSGNRCGFPKCRRPLVQGSVILGEICHIKAASPDGPRYDPDQTPEQRHGYDNLILLCADHHKIIDVDEEAYTGERLSRLKATHEAANIALGEDEADRGATLLIEQAISSTGQSGGITAHTVHQTFNLPNAIADFEQWEQRQALEISQRASDARRFLSPELNRTINRVLYIHGRATANFICASAENGLKPNDLKEDFIPHWPALYPNAPQVRELAVADASALIAYYDSLHSLADYVNDWWEREGQLPTNIFNSLLHQVNKSLRLALVCIKRFEIEKYFPPPYEAWGTITSRIEVSMKVEADARTHHIARFEAKNAKQVLPATQRHQRR